MRRQWRCWATLRSAASLRLCRKCHRSAAGTPCAAPAPAPLGVERRARRPDSMPPGLGADHSGRAGFDVRQDGAGRCRSDSPCRWAHSWTPTTCGAGTGREPGATRTRTAGRRSQPRCPARQHAPCRLSHPSTASRWPRSTGTTAPSGSGIRRQSRRGARWCIGGHIPPGLVNVYFSGIGLHSGASKYWRVEPRGPFLVPDQRWCRARGGA